MTAPGRERHIPPKTIAVDFDGVLHLYTSYMDEWDPAVILDPPVRGAINWLAELVHTPKITVCISSSRNSQAGGIDAMKAWLLQHGMAQTTIDMIEFPTHKPPAFLTIDDRAFLFQGQFPTIGEIENFKPWNRR